MKFSLKVWEDTFFFPGETSRIYPGVAKHQISVDVLCNNGFSGPFFPQEGQRVRERASGRVRKIIPSQSTPVKVPHSHTWTSHLGTSFHVVMGL